MTFLVPILIGLLIGWLLHWLLDYLFWNNRRVCSDYEKELESSIGKLQADNASLNSDVSALNTRVARVGELETTLASKEADYGKLMADFDARGKKLDTVNASLQAKSAEVAEMQASVTQMGSLDTQLKERDTAIADLKAKFEARGAEISGLKANLKEKDSMVGKLEGQLKEVDGELDKMGLGAAAGGAAVAGGLFAGLRGRLGNLRGKLETEGAASGELSAELDKQRAEIDRLSADISKRDSQMDALRADLKARDGELGELKASAGANADLSAELDGLRTQLADRDAALAKANADLDASASIKGELDARNSRIAALEADLSARSAELGEINAELDDGDGKWAAAGLMAAGAGGGGLLARLQSMRSEAESRSATLAEREAELERLRMQVSDLEARPVVADDLTKIKGIGPKLAEKFNSAGVTSYAELAALDSAAIDKILDGSGTKFRLATPEVRASWADQGNLAGAGDWDGLKAYQDGMVANTGGGGGLNKVWGLGSKVRRLLSAHGIEDYNGLASANTSDIDDALKAGSSYYPGMTHAEIHQAWTEQARMASESKWSQLAGYKERFRIRRGNDDLTLIWGIGPVINKVLRKRGITTFSQLSDTPAAVVSEILEESGERFNLSTENLHETWTTQARLASVGDMDGMEAYKEKLTWENVQDDDEQGA